MKYGKAGKAVMKKVSGVESEQGTAKSVGSAPPPNFGHSSAKSAGVSGTMIPGGNGGGMKGYK